MTRSEEQQRLSSLEISLRGKMERGPVLWTDSVGRTGRRFTAVLKEEINTRGLRVRLG